MRTPACLIAVVLSVASIPAARAQSSAFIVAYDDLYSINLTSRQATYIGSFGNYGNQPFGLLKGLAFNPERTLYAISDSLSQKPVVTLNTATGAASFVAPLNVGSGSGQFNSHDFGATFTCTGQMWVSSAATNRLWKVDAARGTTEQVGASTGATITGIVARGETLYGAGGRGSNNFYRIDTATGAAELIGPLGIPNSTWIHSVSMSFDAQGRLWAVINYVPPAPGSTSVAEWADLARINRTTGAATVLGTISGPDRLRYVGVNGLAVGPAPCTSTPGGDGGTDGPVTLPVRAPWGLLALGLGLLALAARRLRNA
ncbi:MAG: hypothetical protein J0L88_07110 [Xanthomonadales bacterium]|nr:hypothetical protein [Xanthomonadales bacterium]